MSIEAMKLALEALEETRNALAWFYDSYPQDVTAKGNELLPHVETVLTSLRQAIEQAQKQEPVAWRTFDGEGGYEYRAYDMNEQYAQEWEQHNPKYKNWVEPLYTSPPQQKQEPVGQLCEETYGRGQVMWFNKPADGSYVYTSPPQQKQEPVAYIHRNEYNEYRLEPHDNFDIKSIPSNVDMPLFKVPQRQWVGLTDEERQMHVRYASTLEDIALSIEAKLKEKNI